jgi:hypothetical protein
VKPGGRCVLWMVGEMDGGVAGGKFTPKGTAWMGLEDLTEMAGTGMSDEETMGMGEVVDTVRSYDEVGRGVYTSDEFS